MRSAFLIETNIGLKENKFPPKTFNTIFEIFAKKLKQLDRELPTLRAFEAECVSLIEGNSFWSFAKFKIFLVVARSIIIIYASRDSGCNIIFHGRKGILETKDRAKNDSICWTVRFSSEIPIYILLRSFVWIFRIELPCRKSIRITQKLWGISDSTETVEITNFFWNFSMRLCCLYLQYDNEFYFTSKSCLELNRARITHQFFQRVANVERMWWRLAVWWCVCASVAVLSEYHSQCAQSHLGPRHKVRCKLCVCSIPDCVPGSIYLNAQNLTWMCGKESAHQL